MEVQDGFILGIDAYCDRWCETCAFTSRCRAFASYAQMEAQHDPNLKPVSDAPPLPEDVPPPPPRRLLEMIDEMNEVSREASKGAPHRHRGTEDDAGNPPGDPRLDPMVQPVAASAERSSQ